MEFVFAEEAPAAGGHYSHAVVANGFVFVSGQLPFRPGAAREMPDGIDAQARQAFANVEAILRAAGCDGLRSVVNSTVYLSDMKYWPDVNRIVADLFAAHKPARTIVTSPLHFGALIEVAVVAVTPQRR